MNSFARAAVVMSKVGVDTTNCMRSHSEFRRQPVLPMLLVAVLPGIQRYVWMIQNGDVIGQEKYNQLFLLRKMW